MVSSGGREFLTAKIDEEEEGSAAAMAVCGC